jgi:sulfide:quinone oxidoreductase
VGAGDSSRSAAEILIAGGGFAAVEAALALRALAESRVSLKLLAPEPVFRYRPAATTETFEVAPARCYDLRAIASDLGAGYHQSRLEAVAPRKGFVRTASGARLEYDALLVATGARAVVGVPGAITFRDQRDIPLIRRLLEDVEAGAVKRVVFALPAGSVWPLPLYELALLTARHARERGVALACSVVTPEPEPLAVFGEQASELVRGLLDEREVRLIGGALPTSVQRDGSLEVADGKAIEADRVVALPELRGRRFTGVPASQRGFVPVDAFGRVEGLQDVYAAGDATTFPIKQGGVAAQQADAVAQTIATSLGVPVRQCRPPHVLQARLVGGERPVFLRTEFDSTGRPTGVALIRADAERAATAAKVLGRYLVPYLETLEHPLKPANDLRVSPA